MRQTHHYLIGTVMLSGVLASIPYAVAEELPDLPEAFDAGWKGQKVCEVLSETESMRVAKCTFPPGIGHEKHFHYPHFGYVLEGGTLRITDAAGTEKVQQTVTGKSWSTEKITIHAAVNIGATTTSYLIVEAKEKGSGPE